MKKIIIFVFGLAMLPTSHAAIATLEFSGGMSKYDLVWNYAIGTYSIIQPVEPLFFSGSVSFDTSLIASFLGISESGKDFSSSTFQGNPVFNLPAQVMDEVEWVRAQVAFPIESQDNISLVERKQTLSSSSIFESILIGGAVHAKGEAVEGVPGIGQFHFGVEMEVKTLGPGTFDDLELMSENDFISLLFDQLTNQSVFSFRLAAATIRCEADQPYQPTVPQRWVGCSTDMTGFRYEGGVQLTSISISEVPLPAAVWLFSSTLLGLAGIKQKN